MNFRKALPPYSSAKAAYLMTLFAFVALTAVLAFVPDIHVSSQAAREKITQNPGDEIATPEMLKNALNFKSAAGYQTLAAKSGEVNAQTVKELSETFSAITQLPCTQAADTQIGGKNFAPGVYCFDSAELAGQTILDGENDFTSKFVFLIRGNFNAKSGAVVSLENGAQAANVFFVAEDSVKVEENATLAGNLVARNGIDVDQSSTIKGRMISVGGKVNGAIESNLGGGTGTVQICKSVSASALAGTDISNRFYRFTVSGVPGVIEIFVPSFAAGATTSTGCSPQFEVPIGPQVITELPEARIPGQTAAQFTNFQLINVEQINPAPPSQAGAPSLGVVNLGTRTAAINVVEGNQPAPLILRFTNQFAITGFIEICKQRATGPTLATPTYGFAAQTFNPPSANTTVPSGGDANVNGTFNYTIEGVYALNQINAPGAASPTTRTYQVFTVAVGLCSGPIAVTISNPITSPNPLESVVRVAELARPGFFLEKVTTRPTFNRETNDVLNPASTEVNPATGEGGEVLGSRIVPPTEVIAPGPNAPRGAIATDNVGGGYATVRVIAGSSALETVVDFFNRSNPGVVKVCKIAGPGIAVGTLFRFSVFGPFGTTALGTPNSPQFSTFGPVSTIVDVLAGDPATGGNCVIVPGLGAGVGRNEFQTFVNGTPVLVVENGVSPANTITVPSGAIRASRIRVLGPTTGSLVLQNGTGADRAGFTPNQCSTFSGGQNCNGLASGDTTPAPVGYDGRTATNTVAADSPRLGRVAFNQRPGEVVTEFTNFIFNPTQLKICKVATSTLAPGGTFNFLVTLNSPVGLGGALFPGNPTAGVSVISAAPAGANNYSSCAVVDGAAFPGGAFNVGSSITVTEVFAPGSSFLRCESPTSSGGLTQGTIAMRSCTLSGPQGVVSGTTVLAFINSGSDVNPPRPTRWDFDGDGKADPSILSQSRVWVYAASSAGYTLRASVWGAAGDKLVPADYDGDGKYDFAVFRPSNGSWFIISSTEGARLIQFGMAGDIPQPGDYDGDGKADVAVFRPSNGIWYMNGSRNGFSALQFGISTDKPIAADYDGDGKTDQAVYRVQNGNAFWYLNKSGEGFTGVNWGIASDIPVPADYNGDGRDDIAVFGTTGANRAGMWFILQPSAPNGYNVMNWGIGTDIPVPADYDGDGKADVAAYRNGVYYALNSSTGFFVSPVGIPGDPPITGVLP